MLPSLLIFALLTKNYASLNILHVPKMKSVPENPSSKLANVTSPVLVNISSCLWISLAVEGKFSGSGHILLTERSKTDFSFTMNKQGNYLRIWKIIIRIDFPKNIEFIPDKWFFFCFTYSNDKKWLLAYLNGVNIFVKAIQNDLDTFQIEKNFLENLRFGKGGTFAGQLTDINIWSRILNDTEINGLFTCKQANNEPDVLDWRNASIVPGTNSTLHENNIHPCSGMRHKKKEIMIYDVQIGMNPDKNAVRKCYGLGGTMEYPKNKIELDEIHEKARSSCPKCRIWIPIFKSESEKWFNWKNQEVSYSTWRLGQPNGGRFHEKCVTIKSTPHGYVDTDCRADWNIYCAMETYKIFYLKGLCAKTVDIIDRKYVLQTMRVLHGLPVWKGFSSSLIQWNVSSQRWEIFDSDSNKVMASLTTKVDFPTGANSWQLEGENICHLPSTPESGLKLMLSSCGRFEYSCSDGTCIPIESKCDFIPDCWDKGDEKHCHLLNMENMGDYDNDLPAIVLDDDGGIVKKKVKLSVIIEDIEGIEEVMSRYTTTFNMMAEWEDSRLTWNDLKYDMNLNIVSQNERKLIWFPKTFIKNSQKHIVVPNGSESKLVVKKKGNLSMSSSEHFTETSLFDGKENPIIYFRQFHVRLRCVFDLSFFPFDTQTCHIILNAGSEVSNLISLVGENVEFVGKTDLATFYVKHWEMKTDESKKKNEVKVNIILKRKISQHLLRIYIPSLFIMIIAQVTLFFNKEHFKTSIPVAITAMLVMYTLNHSIASKLPQTATIKFIDIWIIFGLFLHFLILILLVLIEHLPDHNNLVFIEHSKSGEKLRKDFTAQGATKFFAQKVLPMVEIIFIVAYSCCACILYSY